MKRIILAVAAALSFAGPAMAQEAYLGEVKLFGFNFCPRGTISASGQLLAINQFTALFSLYGTTYGGDGRTTFALPDLRGRAAIAFGQGPGLSNRPIGSKGGVETVTQTSNELANHTHVVTATAQGLTTPGSTPNPAGAMPALSTTASIYGTGTGVPMAANGVTGTAAAAGGSAPMGTMSPFLSMNYCVVTEGIFPSRS